MCGECAFFLQVKKSFFGGVNTCVSSSGLLLTLTVIGEAEQGKAIYRSGAKVGDAVYVTGTLGGSALGLACLEKGLRGLDTREYIKRHDDPTPRVTTGFWLAKSTCVSAMIDVSDGLVGDLNHIAQSSGVGIRIQTNCLPILERFIDDCGRCHKDPLLLALTGGEDYELVFTVEYDKINLFEKMLAVVAPTFGHVVTRIGEVIVGNGVEVIDIHGSKLPLPKEGFEHKF